MSEGLNVLPIQFILMRRTCYIIRIVCNEDDKEDGEKMMWLL